MEVEQCDPVYGLCIILFRRRSPTVMRDQSVQCRNDVVIGGPVSTLLDAPINLPFS
jgi:hypothetical protein